MESSNLYFSAAAVSYGAIIESTDADEKKRVYLQLGNCPKEAWVITNGEVKRERIVDFDQLQNLFTSRVLMLLPSYPNSLKDLKTLIHER